MKKKVLILSGYYVPSIKGGGPIQSIKNLVDILLDKLDFYILAMDRDLGDDKPFYNIKTNEWIQVGNAKVFYISPYKLTWQKIAKVINNVDYEVLYLNSFFSYKFSIVPILLNKFNRISKKPIVLAPRGEFSLGALGFKSGKKKLYIKVVKALGLYRNVIWHATADTEKKDIELIFGSKAKIKIANNFTANYKELKYDKNIEKKKGELKIVFILRVHPKKNLKKAIELLKEIDGQIECNIYGPLEDKTYWSECEQVIKNLPKFVKVQYKGLINHYEIMDIFKKHHVFFFPTLGENFGHVISEALIGGCPIIISDQTPWRGLENLNVGWDIALNDVERFKAALQRCVDMTQEQYALISKNAFEYGKKMSNSEVDIIKTYELFSKSEK